MGNNMSFVRPLCPQSWRVAGGVEEFTEHGRPVGRSSFGPQTFRPNTSLKKSSKFNNATPKRNGKIKQY